MEKSKKVAAAVSAVINYIQEEEDSVRLQIAKGQPCSSMASSNQWGMSGRQSIMQTRNLMQMKAFQGARKK